MWMHVDLDTEEYWIKEPDENDEWDSGERGLTLTSALVWAAKEGEGYELSGVSPGDEVVVLVEHYSDGDTFGSAEYMEPIGVFKDETGALEFSEGYATDHGYFGAHIGFLTPSAVVQNKRMR